MERRRLQPASEAEKREIVRRVEAGEITQVLAAQQMRVSVWSIWTWRKLYAEKKTDLRHVVWSRKCAQERQ